MKDESLQKRHRNRLRLEAVAASDLEVLSTLMQDSIVPIGDILYTPSQKKIIMMVQRFRWELIKGAEKKRELSAYQRCLCVLKIDGVESVRTQFIDINDRSQFLNFLSFHLSDKHLDLQFSESKTIRIDINALKLTVEDVGKSWPSSKRPIHEENN